MTKSIVTYCYKTCHQSCRMLTVISWEEAGSEAAIHTMHEIFDNKKTKTLLLVNAENAFNTNRKE